MASGRGQQFAHVVCHPEHRPCDHGHTKEQQYTGLGMPHQIDTRCPKRCRLCPFGSVPAHNQQEQPEHGRHGQQRTDAIEKVHPCGYSAHLPRSYPGHDLLDERLGGLKPLRGQQTIKLLEVLSADAAVLAHGEVRP